MQISLNFHHLLVQVQVTKVTYVEIEVLDGAFDALHTLADAAKQALGCHYTSFE
jgi:hypothetical protein